MNNDKRPYLVTHRSRKHGGENLNVLIDLLPTTVDKLDHIDDNKRTSAERFICRRFVEEVKRKYNLDIKVTYKQLFSPDPGSLPQPRSSQSRSTYTH